MHNTSPVSAPNVGGRAGANVSPATRTGLTTNPSSPASRVIDPILVTSGKALELTRELWEPVLAAAPERGELRSDLDLVLLCEWISQLEMLYISQGDEADGLDRFREKLTKFFVPALLPR
ncbi:TetR family transcriptional regulator [Williamsia sp. D3]|nr:TetR family transcriptional regulator [Williamsia sp. D3]